MIRVKVKIGDIPMAVHTLYDQPFLRDYLTDEAPLFQVFVTRDIIDSERSAYDQQTLRAIKELPQWRDVQPDEININRAVTEQEIEAAALLRLITERVTMFDYLLFHASAVSVDGEAYIFTAPSGTGKSTHTALWRAYFGKRAVMVNDDKPYLICRSNGIFVCGTPWNGKHHLSTNIILPVKAICILGRAEENRIRRITASEALVAVMRQTQHFADEHKEEKVLELIDRLLERTPIYKLECNTEPAAVEIAYREMSGKR